MEALTYGKIRNATNLHKYIILRFDNGYEMGINSKVLTISPHNKMCDKQETYIISYRPCSFDEYIKYKQPFIR